MLTSFFGKSAPINFLVLSVIVGCGYLGILYTGFLQEGTDGLAWYYHPLNLFCMVFSILLLDFVIRKNSLTKRHNYGIFLYTVLLLSTPKLVWNPQFVIASVCALLSFRRIVSLGSDKNVEKKILDASLWIGVTAYFVPAGLFFLLLIYSGLALNGKLSFRLSVIPIIGLTAVMSVLAAVYFMVEDSFQWFYELDWIISFDFSSYNALPLLILSAVLIALLLWLVAYRILRLKKLKRSQRPASFTLLAYMICAVLVAVFSPVKDGSELLFLYAPFSIGMAEYLQNREKPLISELFLWGFALLPALILLQI